MSALDFCQTCGGHGALTEDGGEIPFEDLSPRRKQGYALGHRFVRIVSRPCPDCDGRDRATSHHESLAEEHTA